MEWIAKLEGGSSVLQPESFGYALLRLKPYAFSLRLWNLKN